METLRRKYLIPLTSCLALGLVSPVLARPFHDVDKHWAKNQIVWAYDKGTASGVNTNHFFPDATISKGELYRMVSQYFGLTRKADIHFTDAIPNIWLCEDARKAVAFGYISDYTGTLQAMSAITRDEAVRILVKVCNLSVQSGAARDFSDRDLIRNPGEVGAFVQEGIMVGKLNRESNPAGFLTRAEFSVVLKAANDKPESQYVPSPTTSSQTTTSKDKFGYALDASDYNIFKDKMLTRGYSLDQVKNLWDRGYCNPDKIDQRTGSYWANWTSYNDFYRYYRGLGYNEKQIKDLWNKEAGRYSYWYHNSANYDDSYNYYEGRGYSNDQILHFWSNGKDPLNLFPGNRPYTDYRGSYRYYKGRGYNNKKISDLWNQGYGWYYDYRDYSRSYDEFHNYFKGRYSKTDVDKFWNNGNYRLYPRVDKDNRIIWYFR